MKQKITVSEGKPYPLGMTVTQQGEINLAAVLHGSQDCGVILYPRKKGSRIRLPFHSGNQVGNVRCMKICGLNAQDYDYNFYMGDEIITDPYARQILGNERWGRQTDPKLRGREDFFCFDWGGDAPLMTPLQDSILYLVHVRGFTRHPSSGVQNRGTFAGITEKIPYLKSLGITALELMPAYEFVELESRKEKRQGIPAKTAARPEDEPPKEKPRINYWGYKEGYYFAPKASYSSSDEPGAEFKAMVKSLHENGIEVIMQFYFPKEIKSGFILEVLRHWVYEYHIDGIHLLGERIPTDLLATDPMLANTKLFYYRFPCEEIYGSREIPDYRNLACYRDEFLYDMRQFLKGDEDMLGKALFHLKENPAQTGVVNFIAGYEGFSLADKSTEQAVMKKQPLRV